MNPSADDISPLRGKKVILADHFPHSRAALREMVSLLGATSITNAGNAAEVLRQLRARPADLVICDYQLDGERDGQQLLEELRQQRLIAPAAMFMMVTGERSYQKVVGVAEFAPDAYLLKPFTANQLQDRIIAVAARKRALARAYALIETGSADAALAECARVQAALPQYATDALRLGVETLIALARHDEAETRLAALIERKPLAWARIGLARVKMARQDFAAAEPLLGGVVAEHPDYMGARDLLAEVCADLGRPAEALAVLEEAGPAARNNVSRLRHAGDLAAQTGDHKRAAELYERVVSRVRFSSLARAEDYLTLADAYIETGRAADAERVQADQRRAMRDAPGADLVTRLMEYQRLRRDTSEAGRARAAAALGAVMACYDAAPDSIGPALEFDLFNLCFQSGGEWNLVAMGEHLLARQGVSARIRERVQATLEQLRLDRARGGAIVPLDKVMPMLGRLVQKGWDDALGHACRNSVAHWARATPEAALLPAARTRLAEVLRKYGMDVQLLGAESAPAAA